MYRFILIDDEELIRKGTLKKLEPLSDLIVCVGEADNGQSAVKMIEEVKPDFVITDMQMPVMHGLDLLPYLAGHHPDISLIVISGFRDFDYIKMAISSNAVEYLLKPFSAEDIQKTVKELIASFESKSKLTNHIRSIEEEKELSYYDYDLATLKGLILGYHTTFSELRSEKLNRINRTHRFILFSLNYINAAIQDRIKDWLVENGFGELALYLSDITFARGFIILFLPHKNALSADKLVAQIIDSLHLLSDYSDSKLVVGISEAHDSLSELSIAYKETIQAIDCGEIKDLDICEYRFTSSPSAINFVWEKEDEFLFRIEAGMSDEVLVLLSELFRLYTVTRGLRLADVKNHLYSLTEQCRLFLNRYMKFSSAGTGESSVLNAMNNMFTPDELHKYFEQSFTNISKLLQSKNIYAGNDAVEKVKIYIRNNYRKDLTQDFIASLFYLNRSYLSTVFRKKTGVKFIDYLNDVRIEAAEALLEKSDQKMSYIASSVGYDNVKYFFRIFKKRVGLTPEEYRQRLRAE